MICHLGKVTTWLVAVAIAVGCVSAASAQVFTGRIDVTVEDATGGRLPGVTVDHHRPRHPDASDRRAGPGALPQPAGRYLQPSRRTLPGFNAYTTRNVQVATARRDAARGEAGRRRHVGNGERHGGDAGHRYQEADDDDQRHARGTAEHSDARAIRGS